MFMNLSRNRLFIIIGCFIISCNLLLSCIDEENFSTSPNDKLSFSLDTISLDTVISEQSTNTYTFEVYNKNKDALRLSRVFLESGSTSPFRVNVDGTFLENGEAFDFEIAAGDSMRVFLELTPKKSNQTAPFEISDNLCFQTQSGTLQKVYLNAFGQDVVRLNGLVINSDSILDSPYPYQISDSLFISKGKTLSIKEGSVLYFHAGAKLIVDGTIKAVGSQNKKIVMRGDRLGNMFSNQPYDRIPGQWGGIELRAGSVGNVFNHCDIHSAEFGIKCDSSGTEKQKLLLENSIIHNFTHDAIYSKANKIVVGNSQITNAGGNCVTLVGGNNSFTHCTIGRFYAFAGGSGVALEFSNYEGKNPLPLEKAEFLNCIISGYSSDEIMGKHSEGNNVLYNYFFKNCLLDTPKTEDENIQQCFWDNNDNKVSREKNFEPEFNLDKLFFSFGLNAESKAVNNADPQYSTIYPIDLAGNPRMNDGKPDIGCYERLEKTEKTD